MGLAKVWQQIMINFDLSGSKDGIDTHLSQM
ncbi:hypothetical protein SAMN06265348_10418 [Pedobacter westerhofensis]|uniref:Uncharacterized protein n=1 Tax=Pedobacter westerhofensis TaxID=425512 RepID=A0A521CK34_9SPHI|nr:hypothetical protein SAMN06265348_10418 [Pedobacter westerhofensis]